MSKFLGIDIGGTNVSYAIVDENGEFANENSIMTSTIGSVEELADTIYEAIKSDLKGLEGIGIGAPSVNIQTQQIEYAPNLNWGDVIPIKDIFQSRFDLPVVVINDANAAAYGEKFFGGAVDMDHFAVITLGTGIGLGMFINGEIVNGSNGLAGEIGHSIVQLDGRECNCGKFGCLETYIAKDGIIQTAKELLEFSSGGSLLQKISPSDITPLEIFKAARKEDPVSLEVVDAVTKYLALGVSNLINILDIEHVFLSGGIAKSGNILKRKTDKYLKTFVLPNLRDKFDLRISEINDKNGAILGSAALAKQKFEAVH
ncbi:MAG: ROK family protein [Flavobacteriales bacterium]|nr:ROK family protein [Flavobacteriales bacterium]